METLAYLHIALAYEEPEITISVNIQNFFAHLKLKKLSSWIFIRLLTIAIGLAVLSIASQAMARSLQRGDNGSDVTALQQSLKTTGYYAGPITGYYGSLTEAAVKRFQLSHRLLANGISNFDTQATLGEISGSSLPGYYNLPGSRVRILQQKDWSIHVKNVQVGLTNMGYYNGLNTGYFSPETEAAVKRFQADQGLYVNGVVDVPTQQKLIELGAIAEAPSYPSDQIKSILRRNDHSDAVATLQRRLSDLGYFGGPINGFFGSITENAVKRFQVDHSLSADGVVRQDTLAALSMYGSAIPNNPYYPLNVLALQRRLKSLGYDPGPLDGIMGPRTRAALQSAQQANRISANSI
jgi:peptidoglycan hydrolase-like protein with peptidoglycan-binding domain